MYYLEDLNGESLDCFFYQQELSRVQKTSEDRYEVAEILKTRGKGKNQQCLVRWQGYGPEFVSLIKKKDIVDLRKKNEGRFLYHAVEQQQYDVLS